MPSPFGDGERLYRTGDLARWRADGELEYLGRRRPSGEDPRLPDRAGRDRGGAAARMHGVAQAVVVAREDEPGEQAAGGLCGGTRGGARSMPASCARTLKQSLPDYMVPSAFVAAGGAAADAERQDRSQGAAGAGGARRSCRRPMWRRARRPRRRWPAIWCEVLKLERVGVARQLLRARRALAAGDAGDGAGAGGVRGRAAAAGAVRGADDRASWRRGSRRSSAQGAGVVLPPLQRRMRVPSGLPLSYAQERLWFLEQLGLAGCGLQHAACGAAGGRAGCRGAGAEPWRGGAPARGVADAVRDGGRAGGAGDRSARRVPAGAGRPVRAGGERAGGGSRGGWRRTEVSHRFDLARGPLFRAKLLRLGEQRARGAGDDAPHRVGRLVDRGSDPGGGGAV